MIGVVKGSNVTVSFFKDSGYQLFSCFRTVTISWEADVTGISTVGSGDDEEIEAVVKRRRIDFEGAMYLNQSGTVNAQDMIDFFEDMALVSVVIDMRDEETVPNVISYSCDVLVTNVSVNGTVNQGAGVSVQSRVSGPLTTYS